MPASLRSFRSTSFGHLRLDLGAELAQGAGAAYPVSSGSHGQSAGSALGTSSTDRVSADRAGVSHVRSRRPRPAVWCSATTTRPSPAAPLRARSATRALVDGAASTTSTDQSAGADQTVEVQRRALGSRVAHGTSLSQVSASVHPEPSIGEGTDVPPTTPASTSTPRPESWRTSTAGSTRRCTPGRRRRSRSSTPRGARRPASGSRCCSTRGRSSSSTSWPSTGRRRSGCRTTGRTATAWSPATAPSTAARSACSPRTSRSSAARSARCTARRSPR